MNFNLRRKAQQRWLLPLLTGLICSAAGNSHAAIQTPAACGMAGFAQTLQPVVYSQQDARAVWLNRRLIGWPGKSAGQRLALYSSETASLKLAPGQPVSGYDQRLALQNASQALPEQLQKQFRYLGKLAAYQTDASDAELKALLRKQVLIVEEDAQGRVIDASYLQHAASLDDLYQAAESAAPLGVQSNAAGASRFSLWAPTAQQVQLCLFDNADAAASQLISLQRDPATGIWQHTAGSNLSTHYYQYLVDVMVPGVGLVRQKLSDPYSVSLNSDSQRSYIADLADARLKPTGWDSHVSPASVGKATDLSIYELHVRDFSINDRSVPTAHRGKYLAFTDRNSLGMRHLQTLASAGITDLHLLPVFDFATVPERGCLTPAVHGSAAGSEQQAALQAVAAQDCFNWGYDPLHYNAPEGSYASNANDGAARILEFRQMVMALHQAGLRVGMDVVFNHTAFAGQHAQSVLDRVVPGYYQRLDLQGRVSDSTCQPCGNTATEHRMMARLLRDSVRQWASAYRIDSFRFDLMGHQPRALMEQLRDQLAADQGRPIYLIGEGWNFGEVADNARFIQASQLALNGSRIGSFSDRARDALRGPGANQQIDSLRQQHGLLNGLLEMPTNEKASSAALDWLKIGLAGTLRDYRLTGPDGQSRRAAEIDYHGQPAGYAGAPDEVVNYIENHDNQTLFDINALRLPDNSTHEQRDRAQILGLAITAFSQGIAYFHAGSEIQRSKSLDGNSYNSGDWFNRIDWSMQSNYFGSGLPAAQDNLRWWPQMAPLLNNPAVRPRAADIRWSWLSFLDLLKIRRDSAVLHLASSAAIVQQLHFLPTGPEQNGIIAMRLQASQTEPPAAQGVDRRGLLIVFNLSRQAGDLSLPAAAGSRYRLHPRQAASRQGLGRMAKGYRFNQATSQLHIPALSVLVFVEEHPT